MPDDNDLPQATVERRRRGRISVVWLIPILAAVVAIGIAVQRILSEGPTITIVLTLAQGVEAGKTVIKYKDVNIGQVTAVKLTPDYAKVEVTAKMTKSASGLMVEDAKFWVVEPRITLSGVSGLGTLLSGNYIGFEAGKSTRTQHRFVGLAEPPIITSGQGKTFTLKAAKLGSLGVGAPVYYRSLEAGQVLAYDLSKDGREIDIKIFVNMPYDRYVNPSTRFWNASGIDVSVGATGVEVRTESLVALIAGGVAFDTPPSARAAQPAAANATFTLHPDRTAALKQPDSISRRYVLYFRETLRGLAVGAPVTMLGLPAGEVVDVGLDIDPTTADLRGRAEIVVYPERLVRRLSPQQAALGQQLKTDEQERVEFFRRLIEERHMRAQLRSGSLLTGQLFVAFDYFPDTPRVKVDWNAEKPVLPAVRSTIPELEAKLSSIVAKLDQLPLDEIGVQVTQALGTLNVTLKDASTTLNKLNTDVTPELKQALEDLRRMIGNADGILTNNVAVTLDQVNTTLEELRAPIATADSVLKSTDAALLGKDAPLQQDLRNALTEVTKAARALRILMDYLEQHPESLIRGKTEVKP
ncbi:MAG TPA: MlaD family protein [Patescibacteria group bacterium]|jgi:paraquat-inducible protein B|nr:MlaD family protein [Patescibacteria group bacterium]